ncbi:hypothetical protein BKI52_15945 [marine bacterium AO1-C]|nr:hypothetical protein BKI52_15945 [marine bacterium AO1-C]
MKIFFIIGLVGCIGLGQAQAQAFYISKDFEKPGVTEYIKIMWAEHVSYWTSTNKKEVSLTNHHKGIAEDVSDGYLYAVSFPNSKKVYRLHQVTQGKEQLICTHPDGKVQIFEPLPILYYSKNFEKQGITEYLNYDQKSDTYWYYTNKNRNRKIKLIVVNKEQGSYKFPGGKSIYRLSIAGACGGQLRCIHPNGRTQYFKFYEWTD